MKVLLLEDEVLIAMDLAQLLEDVGAEVDGPHHSVAQARSALDIGLPDVALLDYNLVGETSEEIATRLSELGVPYAFVTAHAAKNLPSNLRNTMVINKPISPRSIEEFIQHVGSWGNVGADILEN